MPNTNTSENPEVMGLQGKVTMTMAKKIYIYFNMMGEDQKIQLRLDPKMAGQMTHNGRELYLHEFVDGAKMNGVPKSIVMNSTVNSNTSKEFNLIIAHSSIGICEKLSGKPILTLGLTHDQMGSPSFDTDQSAFDEDWDWKQLAHMVNGAGRIHITLDFDHPPVINVGAMPKDLFDTKLSELVGNIESKRERILRKGSKENQPKEQEDMNTNTSTASGIKDTVTIEIEGAKKAFKPILDFAQVTIEELIQDGDAAVIKIMKAVKDGQMNIPVEDSDCGAYIKMNQKWGSSVYRTPAMADKDYRWGPKPEVGQKVKDFGNRVLVAGMNVLAQGLRVLISALRFGYSVVEFIKEVLVGAYNVGTEILNLAAVKTKSLISDPKAKPVT